MKQPTPRSGCLHRVDPLLLEALRFGLTILASGFVAMIVARRAFRDARVLAQEGDARSQSLLHAMLVGELRENLARLEANEVISIPAVPLVRTAWDRARGLPLSTDIFSTIADAYAAAAEAHEIASLIAARATSGGLVISRVKLQQSLEQATEMARQRALAARDSFARALELLESRR